MLMWCCRRGDGGDLGVLYDWFEVDGAVGDGRRRVVRQASFAGAVERPPLPSSLAGSLDVGEEFAGSRGAATVAADRGELDWMRAQLGLLGERLYVAAQGALAEGQGEGATEDPVDGARPVGAAEFERAWQRARRERQFTLPVTGPLPVGTRLTGTVTDHPWGAGVTGLFVDVGLPLPGFVDMYWLTGVPEAWPPPGTRMEFEIVDVRLDLVSRTWPQIRLRPR